MGSQYEPATRSDQSIDRLTLREPKKRAPGDFACGGEREVTSPHLTPFFFFRFRQTPDILVRREVSLDRTSFIRHGCF
jgi:hypothetical protein